MHNSVTACSVRKNDICNLMLHYIDMRVQCKNDICNLMLHK